MTKKSIEILFNYFNLVPIWKHLNYKNIDKMKALLTKLLYNKVT